MKVLVYVEGPSDRVALEALLDPLISRGTGQDVGIRFIGLGGKAELLSSVARKAADHLQEHPDDWVFALPDLYPMAAFNGTPNHHQSFHDLHQLLSNRFQQRANQLDLAAAAHRRFRIHCLKHDLEGLLLAAPDALRQRLGTSDALKGHWRLPVEDQNDAHPPKQVVENLFTKYRRRARYNGTTDAPWILARTPLEVVTKACPQRFAPFVGELEALAAGGPLT